MRVLPLVLPLLAVTIAGCAREQMTVPVAELSAPTLSVPSTPALAFTPPVARHFADDLDLARDNRGTYATGGFESQVVSETFVRTDDRQRYNNFDGDGTFERRAISTAVTFRHR